MPSGVGAFILNGVPFMKKFFARLWKEQKGQDTTEYALLLVLISLTAISATKRLSSGIQNAFTGASSTVSSSVSASGGSGGGDGGGDHGGDGGGGDHGGGGD